MSELRFANVRRCLVVNTLKEINHELSREVNLISLHQFSSVDGRELDYTQHQNYCFGPQLQEKPSELNRFTVSLKWREAATYNTGLYSQRKAQVCVHAQVRRFVLENHSIANTLGSLISSCFSSTSPFPEDTIQSGSFLFYFTLKH